MQTLAPIADAKSGAEITQSAGQTGPDLFWERVRHQAERVALREKHLGVWREITWAEFGENVRTCAYGLMALGMQPRDRVNVLADDCPEWFYSDYAIQSAAGITVGIYPTSGPSQCSYIVANCGAKIWIVGDQEQYDKALKTRHELPEVEWIVVIDPKGVRAPNDPTVITFEQLLERGRELERVEAGMLGERMAKLKPEDTAFVIYTSGTTGPPKGAMHSYATILDGARLALPFFEPTDRDESIVYLPLAHAAERLFTYVRLLLVGGVYNFVETPDTLFDDMRDIAPTLFGGVPRTWERLKSRIDLSIAEATPLKQFMYRWAIRQGARRARARLQRTTLGAGERLSATLADWLVLRKLRERIGLHRARCVFTAAAPIATEVIEYYWALGIPMYEGLGQTETGVTAIMPRDDIRLGTVGTVVEGIEAKISDEGELLFKGPNIFQGYYNKPEATADAIRDGWFHTGDAATIDEDGYVTLSGRVVDMFVLSSGRNIAPQNFENMMKASDYIMDAVLVGNLQPFLTALVILDEETVSHYAQTANIPFSSYSDLASRPEIRALVHAQIKEVNQHWSDREQIKDFRILKWQLSDEEDELTPTMKVRRKFMCERYHDLIEEMYTNGA